MDSFEWNKIIGAVLGTLVFVMVVKIGTEMYFEHEAPEKKAYVVEGVQEEARPGAPAAAPAGEALPDFGTVLASADVNAGKEIANRCLQCHDMSSASTNRIGPGLWNVVNRVRGSHPDFAYSSAMSSSKDPWTYEHLFNFLKSPGAVVPGTKMSFAGIRSVQDRINLIAYLRTEAPAPAPLPAPGAGAAPAAPAAP